MSLYKIGKKSAWTIQREITQGSDLLFHYKGIVKIWTRTTDKCPYSGKIINHFYEILENIWEDIFIKEIFFDDKNGNVGSIEIDYISSCEKDDDLLIELGRKTPSELWLDGYALILKWNFKFLNEIVKEMKK